MLAGQAWAYGDNYDFSAVCSSGHTLYYKITNDAEPYTVCVTYPDCYLETINRYYVKYDKPFGNLVIPDTVMNNDIKYVVIAIGQYAFYDCRDLTSVFISNSVTSIDYYAFQNCSNLNSITIGESVTDIQSGAFSRCSALKNIICKSFIPPKCSNDLLTDSTITDAILYRSTILTYPKDANMYQTMRPWSLFLSNNQTAVPESAANTLNIYAYGNKIVVENATDEIRVYNAMGMLVCRVAITRVRAEITINTPGVYIVKTGNVVKRVMIN